MPTLGFTSSSTTAKSLEIQDNIIDFSTVLLLGTSTTAGVTYHMSGFDSNDSVSRVYWESIGTPDLTPPSTSPALIGTLQYPHILSIS